MTMCAESAQLTPTEQRVLELLRHGLSNQAIADRLVVSVNTVRTHKASIRQKLGGRGCGPMWWLTVSSF